MRNPRCLGHGGKQALEIPGPLLDHPLVLNIIQQHPARKVEALIKERGIKHPRREAVLQDHHPAGASCPVLVAIDRDPVTGEFERDVRHLAKIAVLLRSEEHTSELQSLMRISYAVFCLKKTNNTQTK